MREVSRTSLRRVMLLAIIVLSSGPGMALPISELAKFDIDEDGYIEKGAETRALIAANAKLNGKQAAHFLVFMDSDSRKLSLSNLDFTDEYSELAASCVASKRFHLAESLKGVSVVHPNIVSTSDNGAIFSLHHDNHSDVTSWTVRGVAVFAVVANRCLHVDSPSPLNGATVTGYAVAPYLSFSGSGSSEGSDPSDLRFGAVIDLQFFGGVFDLQQVQISPFFRTDFQGEAEIYGLSARWTPYHFQSRLNGLQGDQGRPNFDYTLSADVEYLHVMRAGNSALASGSAYGWIGLNAGIGYVPTALDGVRFSLNVDVAYDIINDRDALQSILGMTVPLGEGNKAFLDLRYTHGTTRNNSEPVDLLSANVSIKF